MRSTSLLIAGLFATGIAATPALAIDLNESVDVAASPTEAWAAIGEWCSIKDWHPVIAECEAYDDGGKTMRKLMTGDGGELVEEQQALDEAAMSFSYAIIESPLPIADYASTMAVTENGDGATITWSSSFSANGVGDDEALELMTGIYRAGLDALGGQLGQ